MGILYDRHDRQLECDKCGDTTAVYHADDFRTMAEDARKAGWDIRIDRSGRWHHVCGPCQTEGKLARQRDLFGTVTLDPAPKKRPSKARRTAP